MLLLYVCVLLIYASTHFLRNKSVQEKEKVNMLHKAENLYFNVTLFDPHWKDQSKANRPEKCNLLWVLSCAQQCKGPWGCAKNTLRPQYNLVQYLCLMDLVYNYCSTCSSCGQFIARDSCWRDFYISVILRLNFDWNNFLLRLYSSKDD